MSRPNTASGEPTCHRVGGAFPGVEGRAQLAVRRPCPRRRPVALRGAPTAPHSAPQHNSHGPVRRSAWPGQHSTEKGRQVRGEGRPRRGTHAVLGPVGFGCGYVSQSPDSRVVLAGACALETCEAMVALPLW